MKPGGLRHVHALYFRMSDQSLIWLREDRFTSNEKYTRDYLKRRDRASVNGTHPPIKPNRRRTHRRRK